MGSSDVQVDYILRLRIHLINFSLVLLPIGFFKVQRLLVMLLVFLKILLLLDQFGFFLLQVAFLSFY